MTEEKRAQSFVPVEFLFADRRFYRGHLFLKDAQGLPQCGPSHQDTDRLLVVLRQIVQFLQRRFTFALQTIVNPCGQSRIVFFVLFSR